MPEQLAFAKKCGRDITEVELMTAPLLHAPAAAYYIDTVLGIHDEDILNAVRYHTVGRAGMSPLEEIIYIADLTSADRNYKDVNRMRKIAYQSVSKCMIEALKFYISDVVGKNSQFSHHPIDAYNYYISNKNIQETT